jgi:activator of HSP90 ATPase
MSVTPMAYTTANWHWKNKTVTPWAKEWFERELVTIQVEGSDGAVVEVERVVEVDGDVELGRRKSKYVQAIFPQPFLRRRDDAHFRRGAGR